MNKRIFTCEHAGNEIPLSYQDFFVKAKQDLQSHKGYDLNAYQIFLSLSRAYGDYALFSKTSRLLIDLTRSPHHPRLYSAYSKEIISVERARIFTEYYKPYRESILKIINQYQKEGFAVDHYSIHSFTHIYEGKTRNADIGLLYDPARENEKALCFALKKAIIQCNPGYRVRMNYPYRGNADGFTTFLRKEFLKHYRGIEIEISQNCIVPIVTDVLLKSFKIVEA